MSLFKIGDVTLTFFFGNNLRIESKHLPVDVLESGGAEGVTSPEALYEVAVVEDPVNLHGRTEAER